MPEVVILGTPEVLRRLAELGPKAKGAAADALNRTAFEVLDALEHEVSGAFKFAGPHSKRFLTRGFHFPEKANAGRLSVEIKPAKGREDIFPPHVYGDVITADDGTRLKVGNMLAVPVSVKRGPSGRVRASQTPGRLLAGGKAFVAGRAVLRRVRGELKVLYALVRAPRLEKRIKFYEVVERTAITQFAPKVQRALDKELMRGVR